ncbi:Coiled-coil domain-containing protein 61, partial [Ophiophagus hannah]
MESVLLSSQEELQVATKGSSLKEVKILKKVVQTLEEQLAKERVKHQRLAARRLQESRQLADE